MAAEHPTFNLQPSSDDEESFIVLNTDSFINDQAATRGDSVSPHSIEDFSKETEKKNDKLKKEIAKLAQVTKVTISPDSSQEEIQKQVVDIIQENETLKNVIIENNISMKNQYDKYVACKDDITNIMGSYREKFNEAKVCMEKLKEENIKLVSELEVHINLKKLHEEEIIALKERGATDTDLKNELAEAKLKLAKIDTQNETEIMFLKKQLTDLNKQLTEQEEELNLKKKEQNKLQIQIEDNLKLQQQLDLKQTEIDKLQKLVNTLKDYVESKHQEINLLQFDLSNLKIELDKLGKENKDLILKRNKLEQQEDQRDEQLLTKNLEISALRQKLQEMQRLSTVKDEYTQTRQQLNLAQRTITAFETEREDKTNEIKKLKKLVQEANDKDNEIFVLNEQLDLFKADFETEKKENDTNRWQKQQLVQDLQNLHQRMKQMEEELDMYKARSQPKPKRDGLICPKCSFGFKTFQALENHVDRCLDVEGSLP